jgi:hypothetical protein
MAGDFMSEFRKLHARKLAHVREFSMILIKSDRENDDARSPLGGYPQRGRVSAPQKSRLRQS